MSPSLSGQPPNHLEKPPRGRLPRAERRRQLLDVGCRVLAERGFDAASVEEIAERAGVSRPIVYSHFGDKRGLYEAVIEREVTRLRAAVVEAIREPAPPRERLRSGLRAYFAYARAHADGHVLLTREPHAPETGSGLGRMLAALSGDITLVISSVIETIGGRRPPDAVPAIYANALIGIGAQVGRWWQTNETVSVDQVTDHCVHLIWDGLSGLIESMAADDRDSSR